ncbi:hypothetical protein HanXRQr2_Chr13g0615651 [Helianthus annuus]|uniref:Uncharacterized protein n=1 Tax=Helianthus annuus TaxID=4232 RepID=A0A251SXC9_HELAN|nr:hypothetical protein HanXRQr2_Chr13g0615651 [Helianthus annuus]
MAAYSDNKQTTSRSFSSYTNPGQLSDITEYFIHSKLADRRNVYLTFPSTPYKPIAKSANATTTGILCKF